MLLSVGSTVTELRFVPAGRPVTFFQVLPPSVLRSRPADEVA
jgi:hypothetical protein